MFDEEINSSHNIAHYYSLYKAELDRAQKLQERINQLTTQNKILEEVKEDYADTVADLEEQVANLTADNLHGIREVSELRDLVEELQLKETMPAEENEVLWRRVAKLEKDLEEAKF